VSGPEVTEGVGVSSGTAAGLIAFLDHLIKRNEVVPTTGSALRTGCRKVLDVEPNLSSVDIRNGDLDDLVRRFYIKYRGSIKDKSLSTYEQRFRQSAEMYRKWLNSEDWRPASARRRQVPNGGAAKPDPGRSKPAAPGGIPASGLPDPVDAGPAELPSTDMITYPFPIRPGLQGKITLPEDLTRREAKRISAFVAALVSEDDDLVPEDGRLANTTSD